MNHIVDRFVLALALLLLPFCGRPVACSQEVDLGRCFGGRHKEVIAIFRQWNAGALKLTKEAFDSRFHMYIQEVGKGMPEEWVQARLKLWDALAPELSSSIPLSSEAQVVLLGFYGENADQFSKATTDAERPHQLMTKLYLILSVAQEEAKKAKSKKIQPSHVFTPLSRAWTGLWPFCPLPKGASVPLGPRPAPHVRGKSG